MQGIGQAVGESVESGLGRAVHIVGAAHPGAGHRGEHHDPAAPGGPHPVGQQRQQTDLRHVVGVHDGHRVLGVGLGAVLVAEYAERHCGGADRSVLGLDLVEHRCVTAEVVGVERLDVHRSRTRRGERRYLLVKPAGAARGQHHGGTPGQSQRQLTTDLAATTENHDHSSIRVFHGSDYLLR